MYVPTYKNQSSYLHWSCSMKPLKLLKKLICNQPSGEKSKKKLQKIQDLSQMSTLHMRWQLLPKTHENMGIYDWSEILDLQIYSWHTTWMLGGVSDIQNIWELKVQARRRSAWARTTWLVASLCQCPNCAPSTAWCSETYPSCKVVVWYSNNVSGNPVTFWYMLDTCIFPYTAYSLSAHNPIRTNLQTSSIWKLYK